MMRPDFVLGLLVVAPFFQMAFFAVVANLAQNPETTMQYVVLGNAVSTVTATSVFSVSGAAVAEKAQGTLEPILVSPANRQVLFLGRALVPLLLSLGAEATAMAYATVVFHVHIPAGSLAPVTVALILTAVSSVGLGMLVAAAALYLRTSTALANLCVFVGLIVSGVNFPTSYLPAGLRLIGYAFPVTWGLSAVRGSIAQGSATQPVIVALAYLCLDGVMLLVVATLSWTFFARVLSTTGAAVRT